MPCVALLRDEREELRVDAGHRGHRNRQSGRRRPHDARADELIGAELAAALDELRLGEHRLRGRVDVRRDERDLVGREHLAAIVDEPHRQPELQLRRLLHGHVDVDLEHVVLVDRGQHRRSRDAIADVDRDVADRAGDRRGDAVVTRAGCAAA